jgi:DNA helicase HerA-like ATPase
VSDEHTASITRAPLLEAIARSGVCRVEEVYESARPDGRHADAEERDPDRPRRLAAVAAAYHRLDASSGGPVLLGWCRPRPGGAVTVLATADAAAGAEAGPAALTFPPGTRGRRYPAGDALAMLSQVPAWTRLGAIIDGLLAEDAAAPQGVRPGLVDGVLGSWHGGFAWLLAAEPVPAAAIRGEAARVAGEERDARSRASSPEYAVRVARLAHRHRELRAAESTGLWRVHLLAGGAEPADAAAVAGLLFASFDLAGLPYALVPAGPTGGLAAVLAATGPGTPFLAGSPLVAALARPPTVEVPGVRVVPRPAFDVTPETVAGPVEAGSNGGGASGLDGVELGDVLDRDGVPAGRLRLPLASLNRHTFVCGATGSGKSQTIRHLLAQATTAGVPWLVIEPAKAEYRRMAARRPDAGVTVLRPGDPLLPAVGFNPLAPVPGFPLQTHADLTRALFVAAFQADEPFPQVLAAALTRSYEALGWDLALGEPAHPGVRPRHPTLADLETVAREVVEAIGYGPEVTADVRGFIAVRLGSLRLGTTGRVFGASRRLDLARLLGRNVVLEIEDVGDDRDKAFLMGAVLIQIVEHLRVRERREQPPGVGGGGLRHLTVIEEAHRLLRRPDHVGPAAHAVELFAALLAEVRAYGEGLVIAEQIPAKLVPDVIKNTAIKIVHRLPARDDRDTVGATMNLSEAQSRYLVTLSPGTGAVFTDGMDHPVLTRVPDGTAAERAEARTATPAGLTAGAPPSCSPLCHAEPCTLRQTAGARRLLTGDRRFVLWAELAVLGHLVGLPAPAPAGRFADAVAGLDERLLGCALRHAVEDAVASRSAALAASHSPDDFAAHVAAELRAGESCADEPMRWIAACYRWNPVGFALADLRARDPDAARHPDSESWAAAYGEDVPGDTAADQLAAVQERSRALVRDQVAVLAVVFGAGTPSALERALGEARDADGLAAALDQALAEFSVVRRWPRGLLIPKREGRDERAEADTAG